MILADTSIWVDHLRGGDPMLVALLDEAKVVMHPFVIGELALGYLRQRDLIIADLQSLPELQTATDAEVLQFIRENKLAGLGIGYVDVHLLAAVRLTEGATLWTRDKRLAQVARRLKVAAA